MQYLTTNYWSSWWQTGDSGNCGKDVIRELNNYFDKTGLREISERPTHSRSIDRVVIIQYIKKGLIKNEEISGKSNKIVVVRDLMDFLVANKNFLDSEPTLQKTVKDKIIELARDGFILPVHYRELFGGDLYKVAFGNTTETS